MAPLRAKAWRAAAMMQPQDIDPFADPLTAFVRRRDAMMSPLLTLQPVASKAFWTSSEGLLLWLDSTGSVTSICINLALLCFCVKRSSPISYLGPLMTVVLHLLQLAWIVRSPRSFVRLRWKLVLLHMARFTVTYMAMIPLFRTLSSASWHRWGEEQRQWRSFLLLLLLGPACCAIHTLVHPLSFKLQLCYVGLRSLLDRYYCIPLLVELARASDLTRHSQLVCSHVDATMSAIGVGLGGSPEALSALLPACRRSPDGFLFTWVALAANVVLPLLLSYHFELHWKSQHLGQYLGLPEGHSLPSAVRPLQCLLNSLGWLLVAWAVASVWPAA
jgi:hypothetical protein